MAVAEELQIIIDAKVGKAVADLKKTQKETSNMAKSAKNLVKSLLPIASAGAAFAALTKFTIDSARAASDAQEIIGKYNVVFRSVADESQAMAQQLASDFDLAGSTAMELLGNTGDLLTGFGLTAEEALNLSDTTNRLAIDLASFTNAQGGAEAVSAALTSAFSGEREALKTYGIVMSEAMVQAELLEQAKQGLVFASEQEAKIQATLAIAQRQSANAIGDYERTSDSAANVSRRLGEQIKESQEIFGEFVLEGVTPAKSALADLIASMNEATRESIELSTALAAVSGRSGVEASAAGIEVLRRGLEELRARAETLRDKIAEYADNDDARYRQIATQSEEALKTVNAQIRSTEIQIGQIGARLSAEGKITAEKELQRIESEKAEAADAAARSAAEERLDKLKTAYAGTEEGARKALEEQIAFFETFGDAPMAIAVLNDLRAELEAMTLVNEEQAQSSIDWGEMAAAAWNQADEAFFANIDEKIAATEELNQRNKDLAETISNTVQSAYVSSFGAIGDALAQGESAQKAFAKAALLGFAAVLDAIAHELTARAVLALFFNPALAAPALAGAAVAATAAGAVRSNANGSFFQAGSGGDFVVPEGFQGDSYPINVSSGERVRVDNEDQVNNSGGGTYHIHVNMGGREVGNTIFKMSRNGELLIDERAVVRA